MKIVKEVKNKGISTGKNRIMPQDDQRNKYSFESIDLPMTSSVNRAHVYRENRERGL